MQFFRLAVVFSLSCVAYGYGHYQKSPWVAPSYNKSPLNYSFTSSGPVYDILDTQLLRSYDPNYANSWWAVHWITTTSDIDLMVISHFSLRANDTDPEGGNGYAATYFELESGNYKSYVSWGETAAYNNDPLDVQFGDSYRWYSAAADSFSSMTSSSNRDDIIFNITFEPDGPVLYAGGSGMFFWGDDYNNEWSVMGVTSGTIDINGTAHEIDPLRSATWYDRQWGYGLATNGWYWFPVILDNGLRITIWKVNPLNKYNKSFATILHLDGTMEVVTILPELQNTGPWVSKSTNTTYYSSFLVTFPEKQAWLNISSPDVQRVQYGEQTDPVKGRILYEAWATYHGVWEGKPVHGWGINEQKPFYT